MTEKYKRIYINDEPTIYFISNKGNAYNGKRKRKIKKYYRKHDTKALENLEPNNLYEYVILHHKGKYYNMQVHRLVAKAFIPIPQKYIDQGLTMNDLHVGSY